MGKQRNMMGGRIGRQRVMGKAGDREAEG